MDGERIGDDERGREPLPAIDGRLDLEGRRALSVVLKGLTGRSAAIRVGRYTLGPILGRGGCGAVYRAHDPELDRDVAIKVVRPASRSSHGGQARERLLREGRALAKLHHPNVVQVYDVGLERLGTGTDRNVYVVMELVEGVTLHEWLARRRSQHEILAAYVGAARGLLAAHEVGVIHRDFKPANAMVTDDGVVKVLDFGLAREDAPESTDPSPSSSPSHSRSLTQTGVIMGTPRYMAPEQHAGHAVTAATDQYALCVALWEALCGSPPFVGARIRDLAAAKRVGPPRRPVRLSRRLHRVLARGMRLDPADRFADLRVLVDALAAATRRRRGWSVATVGGACLLALDGGTLSAAAIPVACREDARGPMWTDTRSAAVRQAIANLPEADVDAVHARAQRRAHRFVERWQSTRASVCDGASAVGISDGAACLQRALDTYDASIDSLVRGTNELAPLRRLWALSDPSACAGASATDAFTRARHEDEELDALDAELQGIDPNASSPEALAIVQRASARADVLHDPSLAATALRVKSRMMVRAGQYADGAAALEEAVWRAEASGDPLLAAEILPDAIHVRLAGGAPPADLDQLVAHAHDVMRIAGEPAGPVTKLHATEGLVASRAGDPDAARSAYDRAIARATSDPELDTREPLARALLGRSGLFALEGHVPAARKDLIRAIEVGGDALFRLDARGELAWRLAALAYMEGDYATAMRECLEFIDGLEAQLGPKHPDLAYPTSFYGMLLVQQGAEEEGLLLLDRARRHAMDTLGFEHPLLGPMLHEQADAELTAGRFDDAIAHAADLREHSAARGHADESSIAQGWVTTAEAHLGAGRIDEAEAAIASAFGRPDRERDEPGVNALLVRGRIHVARARWPSARQDLLAALERMPPHDMDADVRGDRGTAYGALAMVLHAQGDDESARRLVELADVALASGTFGHRRSRASLAAWAAATL